MLKSPETMETSGSHGSTSELPPGCQIPSSTRGLIIHRCAYSAAVPAFLVLQGPTPQTFRSQVR
ncbi:MAG: hypothetical protein ACK56F_33015, partial [bacterium]